MAGLCAPLSTLRQYPRGYLRMTRGRCGSLLLHRDGLAPSTPCRSPGALRSTPIKGHRQTGQSLIAAVFFGLALCGAVISTASARSRWLLSAVQSRRNRGSAADSHPADSPAMAVPETLCHPFATAKIVVWPGTCSVRGGLIIAARSRDACGDATLCACRRRGERTGNRCDRDKASKCLLHSRPSCACLACGHATAAPPQDTKKFPPLHVNPPAGHRIRSTECIDRGWLRVAYLQSPDVLWHTAWVKNGCVWARAARPVYPQEQTLSACPGMSVSCHCTESLRSSPLRGSKSRETGSRSREDSDSLVAWSQHDQQAYCWRATHDQAQQEDLRTITLIRRATTTVR